MGDSAEQPQLPTVRVKSPDGNIQATLRDRGRVSITVNSGSVLSQYQEARMLESQLSRVIEQVMAEADAGRGRPADIGSPLRVDDTVHADAARRRYWTQRDELTGTGRSPDGLIRIHTTGLRTWSTQVDAAQWRRCTGAGPSAAVNHALAAARRDYAQKLLRLGHGDVGDSESSESV